MLKILYLSLRLVATVTSVAIKTFPVTPTKTALRALAIFATKPSQEARKGSKVLSRRGQNGFAIKVKYIFEKLIDQEFFDCNE